MFNEISGKFWKAGLAVAVCSPLIVLKECARIQQCIQEAADKQFLEYVDAVAKWVHDSIVKNKK